MSKKLMILSLIVSVHMACAADPAPYAGAEIKSGAVYRGNIQRSGVFNKTGLTSVKGAKWKANIGGQLNSSPVVFEDTLYIGGADGFYALNTADGSVRWKFPLDKPVDSSACVANGTVCFTTIDGRLMALNIADGSLKWEYKGKPSATSRGSPAMVYGTVITSLGKEIVMVGLTDGKLLWSTEKNVPDEYSSIACDAGAFYGAGILNWGYLFAYDYETGEIIWRSNGPFANGAGDHFYKTPAVDENGFIYINESRGVRKFSPTAQGNVPKGHNEKLWYAFLLDKAVDDNELIPQASPTVWKDVVYAGRFDGKLVALAGKDGKPIWKKQYPGSILSDPALAAKSGLLIFGCYDGHLYAVDAATGADRWQFKTGGKIFSSPWVGDGVVYVASHDGCVYALE